MPSALVCAPDDFLIVLEVRSDSVLVCLWGLLTQGATQVSIVNTPLVHSLFLVNVV